MIGYLYSHVKNKLKDDPYVSENAIRKVLKALEAIAGEADLTTTSNQFYSPRITLSVKFLLLPTPAGEPWLDAVPEPYDDIDKAESTSALLSPKNVLNATSVSEGCRRIDMESTLEIDDGEV